LAAGKPLLVVPVAADQGDNASRVEFLQVGLRLDLAELSEDAVRQKVQQIRFNRLFQDNAMRAKEALDQTDGPRIASACVDWIARNRRPLNRPEGFPVTITSTAVASLLDRERELLPVGQIHSN
jgi:UDP:flavonoid glycosyltransferase YjiC (YdhE family)